MDRACECLEQRGAVPGLQTTRRVPAQRNVNQRAVGMADGLGQPSRERTDMKKAGMVGISSSNPCGRGMAAFRPLDRSSLKITTAAAPSSSAFSTFWTYEQLSPFSGPRWMRTIFPCDIQPGWHSLLLLQSLRLASTAIDTACFYCNRYGLLLLQARHPADPERTASWAPFDSATGTGTGTGGGGPAGGGGGANARAGAPAVATVATDQL